MKKPILALAAVLLVAACDITDSNTFQFGFQATPLDQAPVSPAAATVTADPHGIIQVAGDANTPCADQGVTMSGTRSGDELRVEVKRSTTGACTGGTLWYSYVVLITVSPGRVYRVVMTDFTTGNAVTVIDKQVNLQ
ncbi:MAG TPA: hypothetical protein VF541_13985 [Longimicrobium sp.]